MPISLYIIKRLLYAIPTLVAVSVIGFFLMRYNVDWGTYEIQTGGGQSIVLSLKFKNPIDPLAELKNNPQISRSVYESEKKRLGLDKPMHEQYWLWVENLFHVDWEALHQGHLTRFFQPNLGTTFNGESVAYLLFQRSQNTLMLNVLVVLLTWLVALPLGVYAALKWRSITDRVLTVVSSVGMAAPSFVIALLLAVWVVKTGLLPLGGLTSDNFSQLNSFQKVGDVLAHLALPVLVLTFSGIAGLQRQMRGNLLDVLEAEYVRVARAKGLPEKKVVYKHAVRTAVNPLVTMLGYEFSALLSGSLLVEMVLNYPGLGQFIYQAVLDTDTNVVMASLVMSSGMLVLGNLLADILLKFVDPRIELA